MLTSIQQQFPIVSATLGLPRVGKLADKDRASLIAKVVTLPRIRGGTFRAHAQMQHVAAYMFAKAALTAHQDYMSNATRQAAYDEAMILVQHVR